LPKLHSLRARLVLLFAAVAVGPLVTVGVFDYARSKRLVEQLITAQTDTIARRAAKIVGDRYAIVASDLLLLSENAEVQQLYRELPGGDSVAIRTARVAANAYLESVWRLVGGSYAYAELRTTTDSLLWRSQDDSRLGDFTPSAPSLSQPVLDIETRRTVGTVVVVPRPESIWGPDALGPSFGRTGYAAIIDRQSDKLLLHTGAAVPVESPRGVFGPDWDRVSARLTSPSGSLVYRQRDTVRVGSFVSLTTPPWTLVSSTALSEFGDSFKHARNVDLALLSLLIAGVATAFVILIGRATRSLEELTRAASRVGTGDFSPSLPRVNSDEVGTLAAAFGEMTGRIQSMMREIEVSRQLAVVGEFAAQLSHEVRNPLTSLKLDLQGMRRQAQSGALPPEALAPVDTCLREVTRLDSVVAGMLRLARQPAMKRELVSAHDVVDRALCSLRAQLDDRGITVVRELEASSACVEGDPELLAGMLMNIVLNAVEAQPSGGRVGVHARVRNDVDSVHWLDVSIADDGPGIPPDKLHEVFRPFYTSKRDGTGLGLPLAIRTARNHGGHIRIGAAPETFQGAAFIVSLPVAG
jgi:signal transduction histidine kinase